MSGIIDKRKRSREDDISSCDSTPLSKRINNLHLSNFDEAAQYNNMNGGNQPQYLQSEMYPLPASPSSSASSSSTATNTMPDDKRLYNPELNETENPFYYKNNKLLHDLHLERLKRCPI